MPSVAMVVIGEEILTGKFADANGPFAIETLRKWGTRLVRLSVIEDDIERIVEEVRLGLSVADFVITTGGIGPTHDDVTLEAIGVALDRPLESRQELVVLLQKFGLPDDRANRSMTCVPIGTQFIHDSDTSFPIFKCDRVFVFPGVPSLFQRQLLSLKDVFSGELFYTTFVESMERESYVALALLDIVAQHPRVTFGSYPRPKAEGRRTLITLEARDEDALKAAVTAITSSLAVSGTGPIVTGGSS
jgi:molybdenum cofactor synthesis domain-containing protein